MSQLPLYLSAPSRCAYLPDRQSRSIFVDPRLSLTPQQREQLSELGFRRSGSTHYRPACPNCQACQSARVDVAAFRYNRRQRRCWQKNQDLIASWEPAIADDERFDLYRRYLQARHAEGDMDPNDLSSFEHFLCARGSQLTQHLMFRDREGELLAVAVCDRLLSGLSAVYTFFDPSQPHRSLGRYAVLRLIEACKARNLPWLYLGYYIADSRKMAYKNEFRPQQRRRDERWQDTDD